MARDESFADLAERPTVTKPAGPYGPFTIFEELLDETSRQRFVVNELSVFPTGEASSRTDPEGTVAGEEQAEDVVGGETLVRRRLPRNSPYAIEAEQPKLRTEPQI